MFELDTGARKFFSLAALVDRDTRGGDVAPCHQEPTMSDSKPGASLGDTLQALGLRYHDLGPSEKTPAALVLAGAEGSDPSGRFVLSRLADLLQSAAQGSHDKYRLSQRVILVPAVDQSGVGAAAAEFRARLAAATAEVRCRVELLPPRAGCRELPQLHLFGAAQEERESAFLFGLPAIVEQPPEAVPEASLSADWGHALGEDFLLLGGEPGKLDLGVGQSLYQGLLRFCVHRGILEGEVPEGDEDPHLFFGADTLILRARCVGLFASHLEVGRWVLSGETLGYLHDPFDGRLLDEIKAPAAGLVSALRLQPMVEEGDRLVRILGRGPRSGHSPAAQHLVSLPD